MLKNSKIITISVELSTHAWGIELIDAVIRFDIQIKCISLAVEWAHHSTLGAKKRKCGKLRTENNHFVIIMIIWRTKM